MIPCNFISKKYNFIQESRFGFQSCVTPNCTEYLTIKEIKETMKDKIVLITGAIGGIGKQTALTLAKMGAQVVITGRSQTSGEATVQELKQLSGSQQIDLLLADLSTQQGVRSLARQFNQRYERLDVHCLTYFDFIRT